MKDKTATELMFESYLQQEGILYDYEPYNEGERNPDYSFKKNGVHILAEVEGILEIPLDRATEHIPPGGVHVGSLDPRDTYNLIRRRIDDASKQLKPHKDDVDYCIIILGKKEGYMIRKEDLFNSLFGDPVIRIPIDTRTGGPAANGYLDHRVTGALRKNKPTTKEMYAVHPFVSGVGIIHEFNASSYYQSKLWSKFFGELEEPEKTHERIVEALERVEKEMQDESKIPEIYRDPKRNLYRVEMIVNPLADKPFPEVVFDGQWDNIVTPEVKYV